MEKIKLNDTPVRTSRNYNINNIKLENINVPNNIDEFNNIEIKTESKKIKFDSNVKNTDLIFGLGDFFTKQVNEASNKKINIEIDSKSNNETLINFKLDEQNRNLVEHINIIANEGTKSTIYIKYESENDTQFYHNGIIEVIAKNNSNLNIVILNFVNSESNNFIALQNTIEEDAKLNYTIIDFGGKNTITNYYSNLIGKNSDNTLNTIYLGKEDQLLDLNYIAELRGEKSNINIEVQGALKDKAKKHFKGTIDFKKGSKKSKGNENENCVLLSDTARSLALPMLLCSEEDVEGNHSTSAGKVGEKELFYIMSRGFELKEAMKLMVRAKFNKILSNIKNEDIKNQILDEVDNRLN